MNMSDTLASSACRSIRHTRQIHCNGATAWCRSIAWLKTHTSCSRFLCRRSSASATSSTNPRPFMLSTSSGAKPLLSCPAASSYEFLVDPALGLASRADDRSSGCLRRAIQMTECMACSVRVSARDEKAKAGGTERNDSGRYWERVPKV